MIFIKYYVELWNISQHYKKQEQKNLNGGNKAYIGENFFSNQEKFLGKITQAYTSGCMVWNYKMPENNGK